MDLDKEIDLITDTKTKLNVDDFVIVKLIGKGSYGKVFLVKRKDTGGVFAMKVLKKKDMILREQVLHVKTEKKIMECVDHPFINKLDHAFQNKLKLYLLTQFCPGGELFYHLSRVGRFNESR
jgi:serine/threonine protein kinase